jgi:predicted phosphodiesterase
MSQLSGLRLSDGSVVGSRVSGTTPPTLSTLSTRSTPTAGASTSFPAATTATDPLATKQGNQRRSHRGGRAEKMSESPSSLTDKISRLIAQNKGSLNNASTNGSSNASPSTLKNTNDNDNGTSIISSLAAHIHNAASSPPSSSGNASAATFSAPSTPLASGTSASATRNSGLVVPKPRSAETAAAAVAAAHVAPMPPAVESAAASPADVLDPTVMAFFHTVTNSSRSPPPLTESNSVLKVAVAIAEPTDAKPGAARNARASPVSSLPTSAAAGTAAPAASPEANARGGASRSAVATTSVTSTSAPDPSNRFLVEAFGHIDNADAAKPLIRTAPTIAADGRYIIIGDVHGCVEQLEQLVEKVKYVKGKDCLFIIGDYVNKGPDSIGVVRACQRLGAYGVLGNHDYTLLRCCARMRRRAFTPDDLRDPVKRLAQKFPKDCEYYLRGLPHIVRIPRHNLLLVHAGLNIEHSLEEQNVEEIMHLRRLEALSSRPNGFKAIAKGMDGEPWGTLWKGPEMVIFGHDAFSGFQSHLYACGIDTGCVYGDPLTCVVYGPDSTAGEFFSVPGLPKLENEMKGLPPPNSDIYEQHEMDIEKLILRPTSRATPAITSGSMGSRPVFLAAPLGYADAADGGFAAMTLPNTAPSAPSAKPTSLVATVTSTNTLMTPTSASPSRLATPTCPTNVRLLETTTVNTREVQRSTLLALSATRELSAIAVLLGTPLYSTEIDAMLAVEAKDDVAQEAFWVPFTRLVLAAAAAVSDRSAGELATMEAAVQLALDVCEEMEAVGSMLQPELSKFFESAKEHQKWPKRIVKCVETLVE